ncbi:MAG: VWA domain-containing protein [Kiritimatiellaeota bacterium]|nr:VWA domain-containing protein [Kiritimatiellota bacterium]
MFDFHIDWISAVFAAAACATVAYSSQRRWCSAARRGIGFALAEFSRLLAVLMICLALLKIEWVIKTKLTLKPEIVVLSDTSDSMNTADVIGRKAKPGKTPVTRIEWARKNVTDEFLGKLNGKFKIEKGNFSLPTGKNGKSRTNGTDITYALANVLKNTGNIRAVVLVSDGDWNAGGSPVGAAAELRSKGIKVFPVGVGSRIWLPDLELVKVKAPAFCLANEKVAIPFLVTNRLGRLVSTEITLESNGDTDISKRLEIPAHGSVQETIIWRPGTEKSYELTLKIPVQDDERIPDNNSFSFKIDVRNEKLKVLVIDSAPRWEYRYLRNALMRDPGVEERSLLYLPKIGFGGGKGYLRKFPTKKLLSTFDVVFLGDVGVGKGGLTAKEADMLAELVEQQGSGLVFLPGRKGAIYSLANTKLADLCPVELDPKGVKGYHSSVESTMNLTGAGRSHFLLMLADTPTLNDYVWRRLPGFFWNARVLDAKPGSEVLAVHSGLRCSSGRMPLIVIAERGNGNVLFMGTDSAWRWRKGVEDKYHYRFWGQVVRWMAHKRHLADDDGIRCFYVPETPSVGQKTTIFATVHDRSGTALDGVSVNATIYSGKNEKSQIVDLRQEKTGWGLYKGEFTPTAPGETTVRLRCAEANADMSFKMEVADISNERVGTPAKFASLKEIAGITKGKFHDTASFDKLIDELNGLPKRQPLKIVTRVWCAWWWGAAIVLLLTIYWVARKLRGEL